MAFAASSQAPSGQPRLRGGAGACRNTAFALCRRPPPRNGARHGSLFAFQRWYLGFRTLKPEGIVVAEVPHTGSCPKATRRAGEGARCPGRSRGSRQHLREQPAQKRAKGICVGRSLCRSSLINIINPITDAQEKRNGGTSGFPPVSRRLPGICHPAGLCSWSGWRNGLDSSLLLELILAFGRIILCVCDVLGTTCMTYSAEVRSWRGTPLGLSVLCCGVLKWSVGLGLLKVKWLKRFPHGEVGKAIICLSNHSTL